MEISHYMQMNLLYSGGHKSCFIFASEVDSDDLSYKFFYTRFILKDKYAPYSCDDQGHVFKKSGTTLSIIQKARPARI